MQIHFFSRRKWYFRLIRPIPLRAGHIRRLSPSPYGDYLESLIELPNATIEQVIHGENNMPSFTSVERMPPSAKNGRFWRISLK